MKFLIQKINGEIRHDFSFTLLESIRFRNWLQNSEKIKYRFFDTTEDGVDFKFKLLHRHYVPVGSVEFVSSFLKQFYDLTPKPLNVPEALLPYAGRHIFNGNEKTIFKEMVSGREYIIKSNDKIKGYFTSHVAGNKIDIPVGNYQVSERIPIDSEWRAFVYQNKLVGLQNYAGIFTIFPRIQSLKQIIDEYSPNAPIAYTLDVSITENDKIPDIIEVHDFFSCGLYGFADHAKYPSMLHLWFWQYIQREMVNQHCNK